MNSVATRCARIGTVILVVVALGVAAVAHPLAATAGQRPTAAPAALLDPTSPAAPSLLKRPTPAGSPQCAAGSPTVATQLPWPQRRFGLTRVWPLSTGDGVLVAVVDTGVSRLPPALAGAVAPGANVAGSTPADIDCLGHGTFVAGLIAARPQPGSAFVGLAPRARVLPVRVTDDRGDVTGAALAAGIRAAANSGAKVIDVSMTLAGPSAALHEAVIYATAGGALVVAPALDQEGDDGVAGYPGAYPEVLAVGAVQADGQRASFSGTGSIGVVAPGVGITSVGVSGAGHYVDDGTSFAAAFVSATAALVRAYYPGLNPAQIAHRIEATADPPGREVPDRELGYGIVDPYAAVSTLLPESNASDQAAAPPAARPHVSLPASPDARPAQIAYRVVGGAVVLVALTALVAVARRRRAETTPGQLGGASPR